MKEYGFADEDYRYTREKSNHFLPHDLLITKIHLTLELAARGAPLQLIAWEQRRSVLLDSVGNGSGRLSVNPDALFGLKDREKPEEQNTAYFFLEVVRSRESDYDRQQSYFMRKMNSFVAYHREVKHTARYGITNFRVITATPTKQRAQNLCQKLQKAGLAFKRFWLTDVDSVSVLDKTPENLRVTLREIKLRGCGRRSRYGTMHFVPGSFLRLAAFFASTTARFPSSSAIGGKNRRECTSIVPVAEWSFW